MFWLLFSQYTFVYCRLTINVMDTCRENIPVPMDRLTWQCRGKAQVLGTFCKGKWGYCWFFSFLYCFHWRLTIVVNLIDSVRTITGIDMFLTGHVGTLVWSLTQYLSGKYPVPTDRLTWRCEGKAQVLATFCKGNWGYCWWFSFLLSQDTLFMEGLQL